MDHLKAIVNNSERNKMTSQSIAIIFGPLFTCTDHFDSFNLRKTIEVFKFLLDIWIPNKKGKLKIKSFLFSINNFISFRNINSRFS